MEVCGPRRAPLGGLVDAVESLLDVTVDFLEGGGKDTLKTLQQMPK